MSRAILTVALLAPLCACVPQQPVQPQAQAPPAYDASGRTYVNCLHQRADALIPGPASAAEIADAAQSDCLSEFIEFRRSVANDFASRVSSDYRVKAFSAGEAKANEMREDLRRSTISRVIRAREKWRGLTR